MLYKKRGSLSGSLRLAIPLFFILVLTLQLPAQEQIPSVRVSFSAKNRSLNQVFDEITLQTGYYFTYNSALISGRQKVNITIQDQPLQLALDSLLADDSFAYRVIQRNIVIYKKNVTPPAPIIKEIERTILRGRVIDSRNRKPLPYATLGLFGTSLGSISNQEGEYAFKIPANQIDPILVVSFMGYKSRFIPIIYPIEDELVVRLEKESIPLQEVIIRFADPSRLLTESLSRIRENYLDDHSTMTAFYRESVMRDQHCMMYSEAVLDVAKGPYNPSGILDQVRIRKSRKIRDVTTEDTVLIKLRSGINTSLSLDVVKNPPDFLEYDFLERYDLEFTDMMNYGNRLVYVISFKQKEHITDLMFQGQLYLDQETLAIVAADFEFNPALIHKEPGLFLVSRSPHINIRPVLAKYHVDYTSLDGRYHISQARGEVELRVRRRRQWIASRYKITIEIAITDVRPGQRLRINSSDRVKPSFVLSDKPFEFDPLFWGIYNTIEPEVSLMESLRRLDRTQQEINE